MGGTVAEIPAREGQFVESGTVLVQLNSADFLQLQQDFLESSAQLTLNRADFERQKGLRKDNINAERTFQQAEADLKSSEARFQAMHEKLRLFGADPDKLTAADIQSSFSIRAPIAGWVNTIGISMGQYIEPNKPLFTITDNRKLHIDLTVFEQDVARVKDGQKVNFTIANDPHASHQAVIFGVNKAFENGQQAIVAHARIDPGSEAGTEDQLLPGMFIDARIETGLDSAMVLPDAAIVSDGDQHYVYVQRAEGAFRQVQVRTGVKDQGFTEITPMEALSLTDPVVIEGAYYLLSQLTKGAGEHHE